MREAIEFLVFRAPVDDIFRIPAKQASKIILQLRDTFACHIDLHDANRTVRSLDKIKA